MSPLLQSELQVARFSGWTGRLAAADAIATPAPADHMDGGRVKVLTEGGILSELVARLEAAQRGDKIDIAMFYVSDRSVIESLVEGMNARAGMQCIGRAQSTRL